LTVDKSVEEVDKSPILLPSKPILGIFAKQPLAGQVKTRLCPPLSQQEAADLYLCSLRETVSRMAVVQDFELVICFAGERDWFAKTFPGLPLLPQQGADLGARLANGFRQLFQQGYPQVVLIGSDAPDLPVELVRQAFAQFQSVEVVLAPATDGGYVLVGQAAFRPELFETIHWGSATVLAETLQRVEQFVIPAATLPSWEDLDDVSALERLLRRSPECRTAAYLRRHLSHYFSDL
jgi:uncharacterized protein